MKILIEIKQMMKLIVSLSLFVRLSFSCHSVGTVGGRFFWGRGRVDSKILTEVIIIKSISWNQKPIKKSLLSKFSRMVIRLCRMSTFQRALRDKTTHTPSTLRCGVVCQPRQPITCFLAQPGGFPWNNRSAAAVFQVLGR